MQLRSIPTHMRLPEGPLASEPSLVFPLGLLAFFGWYQEDHQIARPQALVQPEAT